MAVDMDCVCRAGEPVRLTVRAGDQRAEVTGPVPETARNRALTAEELQARLKKTGGTAFRCREVRVTLEEGLMLSAGAVNALRREGLTALEEVLCAVPERHTAQPEPLPDAPVEPAQPLLTCSLQKPEQLTQALADCRPEMIYLPVEWLDTLDVTPYLDRTSFCAVLPRIFRTEDEAALREMLVRHRQVLAAVAVGNLGHLPIAEGLELPLRGDLDERIQLPCAAVFAGAGALHRRRILRAAAPTDPGSEKVSALRGSGLWPPAADADGELRHCQQLGLLRCGQRLPEALRRLPLHRGERPHRPNRGPLPADARMGPPQRAGEQPYPLSGGQAGVAAAGAHLCPAAVHHGIPGGVRGGAAAVSGAGGLYPGRSDTGSVLPGGRVNTFRCF